MRIHISDDNGHKLSFSVMKMTEWNSEQLILLLKEVILMLESPMVEDKTLY